jgi:hypothetical protein
MKKLLLLFFSFSAFYANAQIYSRSSVTPIFINFNSGVEYSGSSNSVVIPEKFDYNFFGSNLMSVDIPMISPSSIALVRAQEELSRLLSQKGTSLDKIKEVKNEIKELKKQVEIDDSIRVLRITEKLYSNKIANKILASLLIDEASKSMSLDKLSKRAEYNATDADFIKAMNSESKMAAIRDKGLSLLGNIYIVLFDTRSTAEAQANKEKPELKLFTNAGVAYLYKINIDTLFKTGQFDNLVFTEPNQKKYSEFYEFDFPISFIMVKSFAGSASNYTIEAESAKNMAKALLNKNSGQDVVKYVMKSQDDIDKEMVTSMYASADQGFTKDYKPFQVKVSVFASNPIRAKIGLKESLRIDDLYKVTENVQNKNGEVVEKKIGWVRTSKVIDNRKNADGKTEPSTFYKVGSRKVEKGMKLTQIPEKGVIIGLGYGIAEDNVMAGPYISADYISHIAPGLRFGLTLGGFSKMRPDQVYVSNIPFSQNSLDFEGTNIYGDFNIQKIFQANRFELTPFAGAYFSMLSISDYWLNGTKYDAQEKFPGLTNTVAGGLAGIKFGINFGKHAQLNLGYKAGFQFYSELADENGQVYYSTGNPITMDFNRPGALTFGLRLFGF